MIPIAYLFMAGGLLCFASMGIIHKFGDRLQTHPVGIALVAMATASCASFVYTLLVQGDALRTMPRFALLLALPFGASAALGLWLFQQGLRYGHIASSWLLINLSSGIPTVLSMIVYREALTPKRAIAFCLVIASLLLLWWDRRGKTVEKT